MGALEIPEALGKVHYDTFWKSSTFLAVYERNRNEILLTNKSAQERLGMKTFSSIEIITKTENEIYVTISGVPCKMVILSELPSEDENDLCIIEMYPAHTRDWCHESDLVFLTDMTSDGVWEWYPELEFEYMSDKFWNVLGYDEKDMKETPRVWMDVIHPDDTQMVIQNRQQHIDSKGEIPCTSKARYKRSDGKEVIILCRAYILDWLPDGRPWRVLGTYTDITDIVEKDALEAKSVFISRMSHEIRSPLCTILNECELLGAQIDTNTITDTCRQLVSITNDILNLGKLTRTPIKLVSERRDLFEVMSSCTKRHRLEAKKYGIKIQMVVGELPELVDIDVGKFNQVIDNLITNSIKYSDGGVITIKSEYDYESETCSIRVEDEGVGMTTSLQSRAFDEFVQGNDTARGAGIGLTMAKNMANIMGGDVKIERSIVGIGTVMLFTSYLPYCRNKRYTKLKNMTVLIVDDMVTNRVILKRRLQCLKDMGMIFTSVVEASDGNEAIEKFRNYEGDIQLVLMDCHMPILDGFDATVQIHKACESMGIEPVPVIAVTASVSPDLHTRCLSTGMVGVVTKPYSENDLLFSIVSCINSRTQKP